MLSMLSAQGDNYVALVLGVFLGGSAIIVLVVLAFVFGVTQKGRQARREQHDRALEQIREQKRFIAEQKFDKKTKRKALKTQKTEQKFEQDRLKLERAQFNQRLENDKILEQERLKAEREKLDLQLEAKRRALTPRYCEYCGTKNHGDANFCSACGAVLSKKQ